VWKAKAASKLGILTKPLQRAVRRGRQRWPRPQAPLPQRSGPRAPPSPACRTASFLDSIFFAPIERGDNLPALQAAAMVTPAAVIAAGVGQAFGVRRGDWARLTGSRLGPMPRRICAILISLEPKTGFNVFAWESSPMSGLSAQERADGWGRRLPAGVATVCARSTFDRHPARVRDR
jgi:hypothetical protein